MTSRMIRFGVMIRLLFIIVLIASFSDTIAQDLSFGFDFRGSLNQYRILEDPNAPNRPYYDLNGNYNQPNYFNKESDYTENGQMHSRIERDVISNSFEIPLYVKYTTRKNLFFDMSYSFFTSYTSNTEYSYFSQPTHYDSLYGDLTNYIDQYGGEFDNIDQGDGTHYNDTTAFISWFDQQVSDDPYSQLSSEFTEKAIYRSWGIGLGYKFAKHKDFHPYIHIEGGIRHKISQRQSRRFTDPTLLLDPQLVNVSNFAFADLSQRMTFWRLNLGLEYYRYHFGVSGGFTRESLYVIRGGTLSEYFDYTQYRKGFWSFSLNIGVDLFNVNVFAENRRKNFETTDYVALNETYASKKTASFIARVSIPLTTSLSLFSDSKLLFFYSVDNVLDPATGVVFKDFTTVSIRELEMVSRTPSLHLGGRIGVLKRLELEMYAGISRLEFSCKSWHNTALYDPVGNIVTASNSLTSGSTSFETQILPITGGVTSLIKLFDNGVLGIHAVLGGSANYLFVPKSNRYNISPEVNGNGDEELYEQVHTFYSQGKSDESMSRIFFTDGNQFPYNYHFTDPIPPLSETKLKRADVFFSLTVGTEISIDRFNFGLNWETSIGGVDKLFIESMNSFNLSVGYTLFEKSLLNKKKMKD